MTHENRKLYRGTVEYLQVEVTSDAELSDDLAVSISFDRSTWTAAEWVGAVGTTRSCRALMSIASDATAGGQPVYVKVVAAPETPIVRAGSVELV